MSELVLPFVVRIERDSPPARTDALEASARAVLLLLAADRPAWAEAIADWDGQRIRKVVRRARSADWRRALTVDGLDVEHRSAELRVYPPVPVDAWPPELARLQVGGTNLQDAEAPGEPPAGVPVILLSPHAQMTTGKAMAQAAHAAQLGGRALPGARRARWQAAGFPLAVRDATAQQWAAVLDAGAEVVHDGGFTEVEPGTATAAFVLPPRGFASPPFEVRPVSDDQWPIVAWLWQAFRNDVALIVHGLPYADGRYQAAPLNPFPSPDGAGYLAWRAHPKTGEDAPIAFAVIDGLRGLHGARRSIVGFWVAPAARRDGVGRVLALDVLARHPGPWSIGFQHDNPAAGEFWRSVADEAFGAGRWRVELTTGEMCPPAGTSLQSWSRTGDQRSSDS